MQPDQRPPGFHDWRARIATHHRTDDTGAALIAMILVATIMSMVAAFVVFESTTEMRRAAVQVDKSSALQSAQAGIDDYQAKIAQDNLYYFHFVHPAEPLRIWTGATSWNYDATRRWVALGNSGFEYSLKITPPTAGDRTLTIVSTGRKVNDTNLANWRTIETKGRASSVASFQTIVNGNLVINEEDFKTTGPLYASGDITHKGLAYGDLYAEGAVKLDVAPKAPTLQPGVYAYDATSSPDIRSQLDEPIHFETFLTATSTVRAVALSEDESGVQRGMVLDDPAVGTWKLVFHTDGSQGKVDVYRCDALKQSGSVPPENCVSTGEGAGLNQDVPAIGTIYTGQDVVVSGVVQGRVTIASNNDIIIGGDLTYWSVDTNDPVREDILGLIARRDIVVPQFATPAGETLEWWAATVCETGTLRQGTTAGAFTEAHFLGSIVAGDNGNGVLMPTYDGKHTYVYDDALTYLQPPFFPVVSFNYQMLFFREITPTP